MSQKKMTRREFFKTLTSEEQITAWQIIVWVTVEGFSNTWVTTFASQERADAVAKAISQGGTYTPLDGERFFAAPISGISSVTVHPESRTIYW